MTTSNVCEHVWYGELWDWWNQCFNGWRCLLCGHRWEGTGRP